MSPPDRDPPDPAAWGARFGWIVGGVAGTAAGFALSFALEVWVFRGRTADPSRAASLASSGVVPLAFIAGALSGHAFGARGGAARYKSLGVAAGFALAALGWSLLVLTR